MSDRPSRLRLLQHADSFFPSGSVAFSYGLETLSQEKRVVGEEGIRAFVLDHLRHRWANAERGILAAAWRAEGNLERIAAADRVQEVMSLPRELRLGSRRGGAALLSVHTRLGTAGAKAYAERISDDVAFGHLAAVQGLVWHSVGLSLAEVELASAHGLCVGLVGAAIRLGLIGHVAAQQILGAAHPAIDAIVETPAPGLERLHAYVPLVDIALMRHETQAMRLFSN